MKLRNENEAETKVQPNCLINLYLIFLNEMTKTDSKDFCILQKKSCFFF